MSRRDGGRAVRRAGFVCLLGRHQYGEDHAVGAGIQRRVCAMCGAVTIDLTEADDLSSHGPGGASSLGSSR